MRRRISWVKAALKDFREFPEGVREQITSALRLATRGEKADIAKPMKGVGSGVFEVALAYRGNAYRTVYALQLVKDIWVVHAFQKKSTKGIKTPKIEGDVTMTEELGLVRGSENPFRDVGLPDADTKLIKADLAAEVIGVLRERRLTGAAAAKIAGVQTADISRIRNMDLSRFTIDRLVKILNRLDRQVEVRFAVRSAAVDDAAPFFAAE